MSPRHRRNRRLPLAGSGSGLSGTPNRPESYTTVKSLVFSGTPQQDPPTDGNVANLMPNETEWYWSYFGQNWTAMTDATAPQSPSTTWKGTFPSTTGTINTGGGRGIAQFQYYMPGGIDHIYVCTHQKFSSNYIWHPISNKWLNLSCNNGSQVLCQLYGNGVWMQVEELASPGFDLTPDVSVPITAGAWHRFEVQMDFSLGLIKVWTDGTLVVDQTHSFTATEIQEFGIYPFRGGGEEDGFVPDMDWHMDNITIAY